MDGKFTTGPSSPQLTTFPIKPLTNLSDRFRNKTTGQSFYSQSVGGAKTFDRCCTSPSSSALYSYNWHSACSMHCLLYLPSKPFVANNFILSFSSNGLLSSDKYLIESSESIPCDTSLIVCIKVLSHCLLISERKTVCWKTIWKVSLRKQNWPSSLYRDCFTGGSWRKSPENTSWMFPKQ